MKDLRGIEIKAGDRIVYGKSDRHNPIKIGAVIDVEEKVLVVKGDGNVKEGRIPHYPHVSDINSRIVVLPKDY